MMNGLESVTDPVQLFAQAVAMSHLIWIVVGWKCAECQAPFTANY